jgi:hypothetical protein
MFKKIMGFFVEPPPTCTGVVEPCTGVGEPCTGVGEPCTGVGEPCTGVGEISDAGFQRVSISSHHTNAENASAELLKRQNAITTITTITTPFFDIEWTAIKKITD